MTEFTPDPELDLVLDRTIPVAPDKVWAAWTQPDLLMQWFTPAPWKTVAVDIDVRPGGRFNSTMESPEGEQFPNAGCIVAVDPGKRLVFTSVMGENFRPVVATNGAEGMAFTAVVTIEPTADGGSRYVAVALHPDKATCASHAEMGFHDGWGAALDQLVALMS